MDAAATDHHHVPSVPKAVLTAAGSNLVVAAVVGPLFYWLTDLLVLTLALTGVCFVASVALVAFLTLHPERLPPRTPPRN
jgi:hypothetical protein